MKLFLKQTATGADGLYKGGRQYNVPDAMPLKLAEGLVKGGYAEWVDGPVDIETAVEAPPENAAERTTPPWTMKTTPADYLDRYGPDAPNSDLARLHTEE